MASINKTEIEYASPMAACFDPAAYPSLHAGHAVVVLLKALNTSIPTTKNILNRFMILETIGTTSCKLSLPLR